jgi:hypothetical protein
VAYAVKLTVAQPDCMTFPCQDDCCGAGADVWPEEREALLAAGLASPADFTELYLDEDGDWLHRTAIGPRGCVFLTATRGCGLHPSGLKPRVCVAAFRCEDEVGRMRAEGMLPCHAAWSFREPPAT